MHNGASWHHTKQEQKDIEAKTMGKYDKFDLTLEKVPVQFGKLSKNPRHCRDLGWIGSLIREPFWLEHYYRIEDYEPGGGRFFYERRWKGDERGNIDPNGQTTWRRTMYICYRDLPDEIKNKLEVRDDGNNQKDRTNQEVAR